MKDTGLGAGDGLAAVRLARETLEEFVATGKVTRPAPTKGSFGEKRGVFVTLNTVEPASLRGCIGFPTPVLPLGQAIQEATVYAASEDPRFLPVASAELGSITVEVSVLTVPRLIKAEPKKLPSMIRIGTDGLIVSDGHRSGLLLPQVAPEFGMGPDEFLSQTCLKAGLSPDAWRNSGVEVETFQADVFGERKPRGEPVQLRA